MAREASQISVDASGNIVELVPQAVNEESFQADLDRAQDAVNAATEAVAAAETVYTEAVALVESSSLALETARTALEADNEELSFQEDRKAAFDQAVAIRSQLAQSSPESEFADDLESGDDTDAASSESIDIPVSVVE